MKILISGVCGFVGNSLARYFREHDSPIEVAGFDNFIRAGSEQNRRPRQGHLSALRYLQGGGESGAFNLGTRIGHSVREVIAMMEKISGRAVPVRECPRRLGDPPALVADAGNAIRVPGWCLEHSTLESIVGTAWHWHTRNKS